MSKVEILAELPKLTREERREVVKKVHEIDGDDWLDEGELSSEEKILLEARVAEEERNPGAAIPWLIYRLRHRRLGIRWFYPPRFPNRIVYRIEGESIVVLASLACQATRPALAQTSTGVVIFGTGLRRLTS